MIYNYTLKKSKYILSPACFESNQIHKNNFVIQTYSNGRRPQKYYMNFSMIKTHGNGQKINISIISYAVMNQNRIMSKYK